MNRTPLLALILGVLAAALSGSRATPAAPTAPQPEAGMHPHGPDRTLYLDEVVDPVAAFRAGLELHLAPRRVAWQERYLEHRFGRLRAEIPDAPAGSYRPVPWSELSLEHFLGNPAFVAGILRELARLPPGPEAVTEVGVDQAARDRAGLAEFLSAYLRHHPEQSRALSELLVERSYGVGRAGEYGRLLGGAAI
jgi:hypothetical protein